MILRWLIGLFQALADRSRSRPQPAPEPTPVPEPPAPPEPEPPRPPPPLPDLASEINAARASEGLPALAFDADLAGVSGSWARSMASSGALDHGAFGDRVWALYPNTAAGEDIAEGQPTAPEVVADWMDDPPHRANILGEFNRLGVGSARGVDGTLFWVADFVKEG